MPHIRIRSLNTSSVEKLSEVLPKDLAAVMETAEDNFSFEFIHTEFFSMGKKIESYPFIEVLWFQRSKEVQDKCAIIITDHVKKITMADDVVVVFLSLEKSSYYENGQHF